MAAIHTATAGPLVRELVAAVLEEIDEWRDIAAQQAAAINPSDPAAAAQAALSDLAADLGDHLQIRLSIVLATHGIAA